MKSSTLYRSNLSKEKMAQLEGFKTRAGVNVRNDEGQRIDRNSRSANISYEETPNVYVRPKKEKELDTLLSNFEISTEPSEKTPAVYLLSGFLIGALCMFMMTALVSVSSNNNDELNDAVIPTEIQAPAKDEIKQERGLFGFVKKQKKSNITILPADNASAKISGKFENYTVKSGDTLESIIIRFYGKYDTSKVAKIAKASSLTNPNALQIGQKLVIPLD